ncbi:thioesterase family protein [Caulobacter sp. SL161]|uniref:acyl-CoA thioesterase n=1 Tax=Caulobacter sp. SL161 TaxID=2995156 RepID=UPI0022746B3D|nr:acyl-CoA thioesterase domain-containing protein [Caulobacter sp. SL161]MCY1647764.1 thioesterase family protein [Caulobacter sp. SL161]
MTDQNASTAPENASPSRLMRFEATPGSSRQTLIADRRLCVGPPGNVFVFGGVLFGSALAALEDHLQRPVVWSTIQFLGPVRAEETLELSIEVPGPGRTISQARVIGRVEDREIFLATAALGVRDEPLDHAWDQAPDIPPPEACETAKLWPHGQEPGTLLETLEMRIPPGPFAETEPTGKLADSGRTVFWVRARQDLPMDISVLALFGDFTPYALSKALGGGLGGVSLDNTLRVLRRVETDWILCDARIQGIRSGFAHGDIRLFARTGELMAIGGQSMNAWPPRAKA